MIVLLDIEFMVESLFFHYCKYVRLLIYMGGALKLQFFGHLMQRTDSFEKTLMQERLKVGGEGENRG